MKIWVDADACPRFIREIIMALAARHHARVIFVANRAMNLPIGAQDFCETVEVAAGPDVADNYILRHAVSGEVVVTADIPLASGLVERQVAVLSPRGLEFHDGNAKELLAVRDFMHELREAGVQTGGPRAFEEADRHRFYRALEELLIAAPRGA